MSTSVRVVAVSTARRELLRGGLWRRPQFDGLADWLDARGLTSPDAIRGKLAHGRIDNPEAYERANYIKVLQGYAG